MIRRVRPALGGATAPCVPNVAASRIGESIAPELPASVQAGAGGRNVAHLSQMTMHTPQKGRRPSLRSNLCPNGISYAGKADPKLLRGDPTGQAVS